MEHLNFSLFSQAVNTKFQSLTADTYNVLAVVDVDFDELYEFYQEQYPAELNTIFRTRRHYDGSYDKNYIKRLGRIVAVDAEGNRDTIWNVSVPGYFQHVADQMHKAIIEAPILGYFASSEPLAGSKPTADNELDVIWDHFYSEIPGSFQIAKSDIGTWLGDKTTNFQMLKRGLVELKVDALETVLELIESNSLYRGTEFKPAVKAFLETVNSVNALAAGKREAALAFTAGKKTAVARFKNTVIGTLVSDLSEGVDLEKAVTSYESKVAPENYKRPTSLITPKMVEAAQKELQDLGLEDSLYRRYATIDDINVNNVLFTAAVDKALDPLAALRADTEAQVKPQALSKVEEISLEHFLQNVLPSSKSVEVLFEKKHANNLMSLTTAVHEGSTNLFKWNNSFGWSYNGGVTDSLKERVKAAGGRTDGVLRFSIQWNTPEEPNSSDLDAHCTLPGNHREIYFGNKRGALSGTLDVDIMRPSGNTVAVENIIFTREEAMEYGEYKFSVRNYNQRSGKGFSAEIEVGGNTYEFHHPLAIRDGERVYVATVHYTKKDGFVVEPLLPYSQATQEIWGITTNQWVKVNNILLSPNVWEEENRTGNEHLFFIIDKCKNPDKTRGIYNEFLRPEFEKHRKVFEVLGEKTKVEPSEKQASGLGFSSTRRDKVTVRVTGKTVRTFVINL